MWYKQVVQVMLTPHVEPYTIKLRRISSLVPKEKVWRYAWHGTHPVNADAIAEHNFDINLTGKGLWLYRILWWSTHWDTDKDHYVTCCKSLTQHNFMKSDAIMHAFGMANTNLLWIHSVQTDWISEDESRWAERWVNKNFQNFRSLFQIECVSMEMEYTLCVMLISRIPMQRLMIKAYTQCFYVGSLMGRCVLVSKEWRRFSQNMIALWIHFRTLKSLSSSIRIRFCRNGLLSTQLLEVLLLDRLLKWLMMVSIENMCLFVTSQIITSPYSTTWFYDVCLIHF